VSRLKPTTPSDANAALRQLTYIHVTPGTGTEKDDVLEPVASLDQRRRQLRVVVDADVVTIQQLR